MAFTIKLQTSASEKNKIVKDVNDVLSAEGTLKSECSIIDPVIIFEADLSALTGVNYMTISTFGRSYFVNNIRTLRNGLVEISAHVDVLSTYATAIKANTGIIAKSENDWNLYLNDGSLKTYQNDVIATKAFSSGFNTQQFVLALAGT